MTQIEILRNSLFLKIFGSIKNFLKRQKPDFGGLLFLPKSQTHLCVYPRV